MGVNSGNYIYPVRRDYLNLSGGTVTGNTFVSANFSATTFYSGSTNLYDIFAGGSTFLSPTQVAFGNSSSGLTGTSSLYYTEPAPGNIARLTVGNGTKNGQIDFANSSSNSLRIEGGTSAFITQFGGGDINFRNYLGEYSLILQQDNIVRALRLSATTLSADTIQLPNGGSVNSTGNLYLNGGANVIVNGQYFGYNNTNIFSQNTRIGTFGTPTSTLDVAGDSKTYTLSATTISGDSLTISNSVSSKVIATFGDNIYFQDRLGGFAERNTLFVGGMSFTNAASTPLISSSAYLEFLAPTHFFVNSPNMYFNDTKLYIGTYPHTNTHNFEVAGTSKLNGLTANTGVFSAVTATTFSAGTINSGSTNLYDIFLQTAYSGGTSTYVQPGTNTSTGGTSNAPTVNVVNSPSFAGIQLSGSGITARALSFSATTLSGATIFSASTDISTLFPLATRVVNNLSGVGNIFTGGTSILPTIAITGSPVFNKVVLSGSTAANASRARIFSAVTLSSTTVTVMGNGSSNPFSVYDTNGVNQLYIDYTNQFTFNADGGPFYFGAFANPSGGMVGFSVPGNVIMGISTGLTVGFGGSGTYYATASPSALVEIYGKNDEVQLKIISFDSYNLVGGSQTYDLLSIEDSSNTSMVRVNPNGSFNVYYGSSFINKLTVPNLTATTLSARTAVITSLTATTLSANTGIFSSLTATTFSAGIINSGSTNLYQIFATTGNTYLPTNQIAFGSSTSGITSSSDFTYSGSQLTLTRATAGVVLSATNNSFNLAGAPAIVVNDRADGSYPLGLGYSSTYPVYIRNHGNNLYLVASQTISLFPGALGTINSGKLRVGDTNSATNHTFEVSGTTKLLATSATTLFTPSLTAVTLTATTLSATTIQSNSLVGTTDRLVQTNSGGTISAVQEIVSGIVTDSTAISLITDFNNWDAFGVYTGTTITNTYQGQFYGDTGNTYVYLALADNYFARIPRV